MTDILLVDDHRLVREGLRRSLEDAGFDVVGEAENGADGVAMAERLRPALVLMDVSMPVMDGITATRQLRSRVPDTAVVVLTMHADTDLVDRARAAGAAGYLLKDASSDEVIAAVRGALQGRKVMSAGIRDAAPALDGRDEPAGLDHHLTERQLQILQMLADGCTPAEVAERLHIAPKTVRNHLSAIYAELGVGSRSQAIVAALQGGLIELPPT